MALTPPAVGNISKIEIEELARDVGKHGSFELHEQTLEDIKRAITSEGEVVSLYIYVRDASFRFESEWRDEFIRHFPAQAHLLPKAQT